MAAVRILVGFVVWCALAPSPDPAAAFAEIAKRIESGDLQRAEHDLHAAELPPALAERLRGALALARSDYASAERSFAKVAREQPDDLHVRLHWARAQIGLQRWNDALQTLEKTRSRTRTVLAQPLLRAEALVGVGDLEGAYAELEAAARQFPDAAAPRLELMALCADQGLEGAAVAWAEALVALPQGRSEASAQAVFVALYQRASALPLLERVAALHPTSATLRAALAHAYAATHHPGAAARLFEEAVRLGGDYAFEAADQYRLARETSAALQANARVSDPSRRLEQRLHVLFEAGMAARVVALYGELRERGLDRPEVRLRVAYAFQALGQTARAASLARSLEGTAEASRARALLTAMGRDTSSDPGAP